jgi:hypothetical protein
MKYKMMNLMNMKKFQIVHLINKKILKYAKPVDIMDAPIIIINKICQLSKKVSIYNDFIFFTSRSRY